MARRHALPQPDSRSALTNLFYLHRCLLETRVQLGPEHEIVVFNAHLEAFDSPNREEHARIAAGLLSRATLPAVLLGDMNCVPPEARVRHAFADEPETDMRTDQTISILRGIPGLSEVAGPVVPSDNEAAWHSFPAHAPNRRLDYIFHSEAMPLSKARTERTDPPLSDHLPLIADLEWVSAN
jgi:endonuclease/exonuclease/phosphatase family metal-dependent hydrolase